MVSPTVDVLGPLRASVDGRPADLGGPRQRAVLARLVVAGGEVVSTDRLIDDLWDDSDVPAKALAVLQVHVSHLRRALEPDRPRRAPATVLVSAAPGYALRLPPAAVDAWRFDDLVRRAATAGPAERAALLAEALSSWQGPAYAEVADEEWARPEVARLTELRLAAVEARAEAELVLGRPAAAIADLDRHLHDHPAREEAVRLLALALYRTGRQGDALAVLRRAREYLAEELGVDPGPALRELEADVLAQAPALSRPASAAVVAVPAKAPPARVAGAVGREAELAVIARAAHEGGGLIWIAGDAGGGKTTLAEAALAALTEAGWRVARGRCPEVDGAPPAWAWSEILSGEFVSTPDANPFQLGRTIAGALTSGTAVLLDDMHRADDLTLQLLRQVLAELAGRPVLVLATYRSAEAGDALRATIGALLTGTVAHLQLGGLDAGAVAELAAAHGLADPGPEAIAMLAERTGGNPLFVRELAKLIAAEGPAAARTAVPAGVREVLRRRVARLPDAAVIALRQAAVLGRETDVEVLAAVARRDPDDLLDALETAVLAGLLDEPGPGRVRFTHALVRDTLYDDTPLLRRTRLHAAALAALRDRGADAATLARHAIASAGRDTAAEAVEYAVVAAREAEAVGAWGESARQWTAALRLADQFRSVDVASLLAPAVTAVARSGDSVQARGLYLRAVSVAPSPEVLTAWDAPLIWTTRTSPAPDPATLSALRSELSGSRGEVRARLLLALFRELEGDDVADAITVSGEALALARTAGDARLLCAALNARAYVALGPDLRDERRARALEYQAVAAAAGEVDHEATAHWLLFLDASARTDFPAALAEMELAVARSSTGQLGGLLAVVATYAAMLDLMAGRVDEAVARFDEASRRLTEHGAINGELMALIGRVGAGTARGDLSGVRDALETVHRQFPHRVTDPLVLARLDAGRGAEARALWATRGEIDRDYYWLALTTLRAHAAARLGDADAAGPLYEELRPYAGRLAGADSGTLYVGPVDAALAALAEVLGLDPAPHRAAAAQLLARVRDELTRTPGAPGGGTAPAGA